MAVAGGAFAQSGNARAIDASGVTLFGVADVAINQLAVDGVVSSLNRLEGSGRNESSRLGFRGVEDIGGGWGAAFWLEAGYTVDDGAGANTTINNTAVGDKIQLTTSSAAYTPNGNSLTGRQGLTFNRASVVSLLNKDIGEIRLGRDYAPSFWNQTYFDPFGTVGVGAATNVTLGALSLNSQVSSNPIPSVRTSNSIGWLSNDMGGFRAQLQYAFSEVPAGCDGTNFGNVVSAATTTYCPGQNGDGRTVGMRLQYNNGPLSTAIAYTKAQFGDLNTIATGNVAQGVAVGSTTPASVATAATAVNTTNSAIGAYLGNLTTMNVAGSYTLGATKLMGQWGQQTLADTPINNAAIAAQGAALTANSATTTSTGRQYTYQLIGATHTIGAWTLKGSYTTGSRSETNGTKYTGAAGGATTSTKGEDGGKMSQVAVGAVYDLSKRTALYGTYSSLKMTVGGSSAGTSRVTMGLTGSNIAAGGQATATGIDLGIRHRF